MSKDATDNADVPTDVSADPARLPDDPAVLQRMVMELLTTLHDRDRRVEQLQHQLDQLLRRLFGPRAERIDPAQMKLFAELIGAPAGTAPSSGDPDQEDASSPSPPESKRNGHGRRQLPTDLPRVQMTHDVPEAQRLCPCCGQARCRIGQEASEQLEYQPASLYIIEHVRPKYACKHCQEHVTIADKPPQPIDKGLAGPGLLAQVIVSKFTDHLPLYRLERIFKRQGVVIPRSTMCGWVKQCADLLRPLYDLMAQRVRRSGVIHTDDTPVPVQDKTRDKTRQGRFWVYLGDAAHPDTVFDYTPNRSRDGPVKWLDGFKGYLQADAFGGYDGIYAGGGVIEVACWAHARRKFYDARLTAPAPAHTAMAYIRKLYDVEDEAKTNKLDLQQRGALRQQQSRPLLQHFREWLVEQAKDALPKSPIGQAIGYTLNNFEALTRYTDDVPGVDLAIDNNAAERALRSVAIGRKNYLFMGSDAGGRSAAVHYSLVATALRHGLDPWAYLRDVLSRIGDTPLSQLESLLPDQWQPPTVEN